MASREILGLDPALPFKMLPQSATINMEKGEHKLGGSKHVSWMITSALALSIFLCSGHFAMLKAQLSTQTQVHRTKRSVPRAHNTLELLLLLNVAVALETIRLIQQRSN